MHPQRNSDVRTTLLPDGCVVLFSTKTDWAQILNPTGALVWEFCDGEHSVDEIASEVSSLLGQPSGEKILPDVEALVKELSEGGLLLNRMD